MERVTTGNSSAEKGKRVLPKGQQKWLPLLLLIWILIKIGQIPKLIFKVIFWLIKLPFRAIFWIFKGIYKGFLSILHFKPIKKVRKRKVLVTALTVKKHRRRGRPRTTPLRIYLYKKLRRGFRRFVPSPLRVGIALGVVVAAFFIYSLFLIVIARDIPSPQNLANDSSPLSTEIYDRNGQLLYRLYEGRNRILVNLSDLSPYLIDATVSIEDKNFWGHPGVDLLGISRALISNSHGDSLQGGSTITQQLIKNTLLTPDRTWQRKLKEILLAYWTERLFTKNQILQMYFNSVAYGGPAWGIEAASQTYFGKSSRNLTLAESAYLAGLPASPSSYSPYGPHPEYGLQREGEVLARMVEDGYITKKQAEDAKKEKLSFQPQISSIKAPHFVMYVRSLLAQKYGEKEVSQGGLRVTTSLDMGVQKMVEDTVYDQVLSLAPLNVTNGAAMVEDPKTGQILAMVGSKNYFDPKDGNYNVALSPRQPGSSIKPITYATAFKQGYSPGTVIIDAPTVFTNPWGQSYAPVNYDGNFHGAVSIRTALGSSFNVPAVKTLALVGIPNMLKTAHDMGITTLNDTDKYGLSLTLGAGEVKLVDMMTVYSTFASMGIKHDPTPILKVTDSHGEVLEDNTGDNGVRALPSGIAYMIVNILSDNKARTPAFGPSSLLNIPGHTVAVKTGTTDSKRDNWTFGFNPNYVVGVWVGNNDNSPMDPSLTSGITGASPIWNKIITSLIGNSPDLAFDRPSEVGEGTVDGNNDLVLVDKPSKPIVKQSKNSEDHITYTDPFNTYTTDQSGQIIKP